MHIKVQLPSGVEAETYAITTEGKRVQIRELIVEPIFFSPSGQVTILYLESKDSEDDTIMRYVLKQSGKTGHVSNYRLEQRTPSYEANKAALLEVEAEEEAPETLTGDE